MRHFRESLKEYARGITGGLLFSLPILYTMEVWWTGITVQAYQLLIYVAVTFLLLLGYNRYAGLHPDASWRDVVIDSIEEMGIGLFISFFMLLICGRIDLSNMGADEMMGKIIVESMTVAIGVSIGTAQLGGTPPGEEQAGKENPEDEPGGKRIARIVLGLCGSIVIAGNIAPTEEVQVIAMEAHPLSLLFMVFGSLFLGAVILFFSDFKGGRKLDAGNRIKTVSRDTGIAYIIALTSSAFMLWFFGSFAQVSFATCFHQCIVLGFPAMLGASAGRLLIKGTS